MKYLISFSLLIFLFCSPLFAQYDKLYKGIQKTHKGYFDEAIVDLEEGLRDLSVLNDADKARAYTHLAIAYLQAGVRGDMKDKFKDPLLKSAKAIRQAEVADKDKRYSANLSSTSKLLQPALFNYAARQFNDKKYNAAKTYAEASARLNPKDYSAQALLGSALQQQNKKREAIKQFDKAIKTFASSSKIANPQIATAFIEVARAHLAQNDPKSALDIAQQGKKYFTTYPKVMRQLTQIELISYEKSPSTLLRGRKAYESAIQKYPQDTKLKSSFASLLIAQGNTKDKTKGYSMFEKIYARYPKNYEANAQLAALHISKAKAVTSKMTADLGDKQFNELKQEAVQHLNKAYPFVKTAYELNPNEGQWLDQLISISAYSPTYKGEHEKWKLVRKDKKTG